MTEMLKQHKVWIESKIGRMIYDFIETCKLENEPIEVLGIKLEITDINYESGEVGKVIDVTIQTREISHRNDV